VENVKTPRETGQQGSMWGVQVTSQSQSIEMAMLYSGVLALACCASYSLTLFFVFKNK